MIDRQQAKDYFNNLNDEVKLQVFYIALLGNEEEKAFLFKNIIEFDKLMRF